MFKITSAEKRMILGERKGKKEYPRIELKRAKSLAKKLDKTTDKFHEMLVDFFDLIDDLDDTQLNKTATNIKKASWKVLVKLNDFLSKVQTLK